MATPSINTIPADVVLEIMARLPVKSLMRLRLISKSFFSNTAAPNFISSHLALSKSSRYVALPSCFLNPPQSSIAILDKSFFEVLRPEIPFSFSPRSEPEVRVECIYFLVGSCNGLLCVTDRRKDYFGRVVVLWNPMIGKFKSISDTSLDSYMLGDTTPRITLGFGYDDKNDDYKIIRIVISEYKTESSTQAEIYSLKTNSWKRLEFKVIRLPQNYNRGTNPYCSVDLMVLKESLALTIFYDDMEDEVVERFRVWKMKKDREVESWTIQILPIIQFSYIYGFTEDGELMFSQNDDFEVSLYNLDTGALKESSFMVDADFVVLFS